MAETDERRTVEAGQRIATIDILRGLVIVIMALDHIRDYVHISGFAVDPIDFHQSNPILYATRWITHLCAPTFIFLAGVSAWLTGVRWNDKGKLSRFLLTRGLWLIFLEVTVVGFGWSFWFPMPVFLAIMWAIGWSMIALSALVFLPRQVVLAVGLVITLGHNLLDGVNPAQLGGWAPLWHFLFVPNIYKAGGFDILLFYPVLPWIGVIALGYGLGDLFLSQKRDRWLGLIGAAMLAAFLALRYTNLYGNPRPWAVQDTLANSVMDFMNVAKYPPSLLYVCATLGIVLLLTPWLDRLPSKLAGFFRTFGAVPMMAYLAHLYIMHAVSIAAHLIAGKSLNGQFNSIWYAMTQPDDMKGTDMPLWVVYVCWAVVIALVYPICRYWQGLKARRRDWWLSYL